LSDPRIQDLLDLGVTYADVLGSLVVLTSSAYFKPRMQVVGLQITIPDNSTSPYYLFVPPSDWVIHGINNASYGKLTNTEVTFTSNSTYALTVPTTLEKYTVYSHGHGLLFATDTDPQTIVLECLMTDKNTTAFADELNTTFLGWYYNAYIEELEAMYNYTRRYSTEKKNFHAQLISKQPRLKIGYSQAKLWAL